MSLLYLPEDPSGTWQQVSTTQDGVTHIERDGPEQEYKGGWRDTSKHWRDENGEYDEAANHPRLTMMEALGLKRRGLHSADV